VGNIKFPLVETECDGVDWINVAQDRIKWRDIENIVINLRVSKNSGKFLIL
jgi:hypothetical protein